MKYIARAAALLVALFAVTHVEAQQNTNFSVQVGSQPVTIALSNPSQQAVSVYWFDFTGRAQQFGSLASGQSMQMKTYPGHLWMLSDGVNSLGTYRATTAPKQKFSPQHPNARPRTAIQQMAPQLLPSQQTPQQQNPQNGNPTTGQTAGGMLKRLIDKKIGRTPQPSSPPANPSQPTRNPGVVPAQPSSAPANIAKTGSKMSSAQARKMLSYHNKVRREVGVGNVSWSPQIAQFAQQWANHLANIGQFSHRPQNQQQYGENLAGGMGYADPVMTGLQNWYGEKKLYRPAGAPFSMKLMAAGHYTQMVWRGTTQIGAGMAVCKKGQYKGWTIIVCNYNPRGNMLGQPAF